MDYFLLILGFFLLVKGADFFVSGSSSIAKRFGIQEFIIGLTLVAFGTSAPELAVSTTAAIAGQNEIAISNVLGSNLFNIMAVLGFSSLMVPIAIEKNIVKKDLPFSLIVTIALLIMSLDTFTLNKEINLISHLDGFILLCFLGYFLYKTIKFGLSNKNAIEVEEIQSLSISKSIFLVIVGLAGVVLGGDLVVKSASNIARFFQISETIIGLTIVALGTSLPEFVTTVVAAKKGSANMALGNVVGSNIFNLALILGLTTVIKPIAVKVINVYDILILIAVSFILLIMCATSSSLKKVHGIILIILLVAYYTFIFAR